MSRKKAASLHDVNLGLIPELPAQDIDTPLLTAAEMKEIEAQASKEVQEELKAKLRQDYLSKTKAELKKKALFVEGKDAKGENVDRILIDLPKFSDRITLDGVIYFHNVTYSFTAQKAATIREIIYRQWLHHAEINGLDMNEMFGRKPYNATIRPKH